MDKISTLLIDDEISALNTLRGMLETYFPQINILGTARSVSEALLKVQRSQPDLVFLDIEMPPLGTGFEFLEKCPNANFGVIFVTAYPNYAIKAINAVQPWGYLVKPFSITDLSKAVLNANVQLEARSGINEAGREPHRLLLNDSRKGSVVINIRDIAYCEADGTTTAIFYQKDGEPARFIASRTLKDIEEQLPGDHFCRCHHSFLVNLKKVERYERTGRNGLIHLQGRQVVPISVGKMDQFEVQFAAFIQTPH